MFLFPWNWDNFFLRCRNNTIYRTTLMDELSNVVNTITSLKQNDLLNVMLYGEKNFDSNNSQSMIGTKTLIGIAIKVYSPQPSNLSHTLKQFVIFKPLGYCFEETIGFDVKTGLLAIFHHLNPGFPGQFSPIFQVFRHHFLVILIV